MITDFASSSYLGDVEMTYGEHVARMLEKLFFDKKFIEEVEEFRRKQRIPVAGFKDKEAYERYIRKHVAQKTIFTKKGIEMAKERKLPGVYAYWIESFLWLDFMCAMYIIGFEARMIPGHGYAIMPCQNKEDDYIVFRVYRGASLKGFIRFIKKYSFLVENQFDASFKGKKQKINKLPQVRKTNNARNAEVFMLYKEKKLNIEGVWHDPNTSKEDRPKSIRGLSVDSIRKIIIEERRKEKIIYRHAKSK